LSYKSTLSAKKKEELYKSVIPIASEFRNRFLDKDRPIKNTFETLEQLGYFIVRFPTHDSLSGFHIKKGNYDCIFVNSSHSLGRQYFSAWHECYHAYTRDGGGISLRDDIKYDETEYKAECFAGCILMPEELVKDYIDKHISDLTYISYEELIIMQNFFRVSFSALITRLIQLFPQYKQALSNRYPLSKPNNAHRLLELTRKVEGDLSLIQPTNDFSVSQKFYERLHDNLQMGRITVEKAQAVLEFLESVRDKYES